MNFFKFRLGGGFIADPPPTIGAPYLCGSNVESYIIIFSQLRIIISWSSQAEDHSVDIKMDLKEDGRIDWIKLAQDWDRLWELVNAVKILTISPAGTKLSASQEGLCCMQFIGSIILTVLRRQAAWCAVLSIASAFKSRERGHLQTARCQNTRRTKYDSAPLRKSKFVAYLCV